MSAPSRELLAGVDLGGTNMTIGVVDGRGALLGKAKRKTKAKLGRDAVIERIVEGIDRACADAGVSRAQLRAVGIGAPGPVDVERGTVIKSGNLGWTDEPLRDLLASELGVPVTLDNDVNVAAYGEVTLGAARGHRHAIAVWVGTGLGGAFIFDGKIFPGSFYTAGELGYTIVAPHGGPGSRTLEEHASRSGMAIAIRRLLPSHPDSVLHRLLADADPTDPIGSSIIAEAYADGDELARSVVHHAADTLGLAIANWVTMLSVDAVILGGGVIESFGKPFVARIRKGFERWVFPARCRACELLVSELGDLAGVYGAAMLAQGLASDSQSSNGTKRGGGKQP
jgi:glucokinase